MPCLLHTIANQNNQAIYNAGERIAEKLNYGVDEAYTLAYELGLMDNYTLLADTLKKLSDGEFDQAEYDLNLVFEPDVIGLKDLDLFAFVYAMFCECNMNTLAHKLADFVESLV